MTSDQWLTCWVNVASLPHNGSICPRWSGQPSGDAVTLMENSAIVSQGTTGLVTWTAALYLAEWALQNPDTFAHR